LQKLPYQLIVSEKEKAAEKVAVRTRIGEDLGQMSLPTSSPASAARPKRVVRLSWLIFGGWKIATERTQRINIEINAPKSCA